MLRRRAWRYSQGTARTHVTAIPGWPRPFSHLTHGCGSTTGSSNIRPIRAVFSGSRSPCPTATSRSPTVPICSLANASSGCISGTRTFPRCREGGTTIRWARRMQRSISISLHELARYLSSRPDLCDIWVICGDVPSATRSQCRQIEYIMAHYGFETMMETRPLPFTERLHRLGENILISLTVFAQNPAALRLDTLRRVRVPIYLSRRTLERKFGSQKPHGSRGGMMSFVPFIDEATTLARSLCDICLAGCLHRMRSHAVRVRLRARLWRHEAGPRAALSLPSQY